MMDVSNAWKLDIYLQQIIRDNITLDEDERKDNNKKLQEVLHKTLLQEMKKTNPLFKKLFIELHYGGSFYENLKVGDPNEFDINVELRLQVEKDFLRIVPSDYVHGFAKIQVKPLRFQPNVDDDTIERVSKWFDRNGNLQRTDVVNWMKSVVDSALGSAVMPKGVKVTRRTSGPAITLDVSSNGRTFSVDLVPVFGFHTSNWPPEPFRRRDNVPRGKYLFKIPRKNNGRKDRRYNSPKHKSAWRYNRKKWFVVPKSPGSYAEYPSLWRLSFYNQEKELMKDLGHMKPVLKLIKLLRDIFKWDDLSSYYIKTIFMWEQTKHYDDSFWTECCLGSLYLHMLARLEAALREGHIGYFWDERLNLIRDMRKEFVINTKNCIARIRRNIMSNLNGDAKYICQVYDGKIETPTV